jgi:hypothetical protein
MDKFNANDVMDQQGKFTLRVFRADGRTEEQVVDNLFVSQGMTYLAALQSTTTTSVMNYMLVGTISTAATLTDVNTTMGEVDRNIMASRVNVANILTEVCTFAGGLDGLTNLVLREVGVTNDARSGGFGSLRSRSTFATITLAASDFLQIQYSTTVGSQ